MTSQGLVQLPPFSQNLHASLAKNNYLMTLSSQNISFVSLYNTRHMLPYTLLYIFSLAQPETPRSQELSDLFFVASHSRSSIVTE